MRNHRFLWLAVAPLLAVTFASCSEDAPVSPVNWPPEAPRSPTPANGSAVHALQTDLTWICNDKDRTTLFFDVYLDSSSPPTARVSAAQTENTYSAVSLAPGTTYYWKVKATDGAQPTEGPVWSFTTVNKVPAVPSNPTPSDAATDVARDAILMWSSSDPDSDTLTYDVYVSTVNPPTTLVSTAQSDTTYAPGTLSGNMTYYWRVIAKDGMGQTASPVWSFKTEVNLPSMSFILIAAGTFTMGSPVAEPFRWVDRETQHEVTLTKDFMLLAIEVTEELWDAVMGGSWSTSQLPHRPAYWAEALQFCNALSAIEGLNPAYDFYQPGRVKWDPSANGYRLPSEAEWEYACRAGTTTAFQSGDIVNGACSESNLDLVGWYCGNSVGRHEVAEKTPNAWGSYDMHGNVAEYCWDVYQKDYENLPNTNPVAGGFEQDATLSDSFRVIRGGDFAAISQECRSATRMGYTGNYGLRIVRSIN